MESTCNLILDKAPGLSAMEGPWSNIHIVKDLTKSQRKDEDQFRTTVQRRNTERSEVEKLNFEWKVVGRRGERRIVKVSLREELLDEQGLRGHNRGNRGRRGNYRGRRAYNQRTNAATN